MHYKPLMEEWLVYVSLKVFKILLYSHQLFCIVKFMLLNWNVFEAQVQKKIKKLQFLRTFYATITANNHEIESVTCMFAVTAHKSSRSTNFLEKV